MSSFAVLPMNQEISLRPGEVYEGYIEVLNPADATEDFYYAVSLSPYGVKDENYTVDFETKSDYSQIVDWITFEETSGVVAPNELKKINFTITVPYNAPAGGQYAMIGVSSDPKHEEGEGVMVRNVYEMASIIYATVAGETKHEGEIISNYVPGFVTNGLPVVSATIANDGNVHETAKITLNIKNAISGETIFPKADDLNVYNEVIMPGSTRYITRQLDNIPLLGIFEVTQSIDYLDGSSELAVNTTTMVSCPLWFMLLVVITFGAIVGSICGMIARHRKRRRVF